ncbi:MAG: metalloregulator ArsR/SmtB family transcription factor [Caloramator sp.]|nr:metalloregulator ArsR/SmtB family transcription factor [Caloramator sp.]
MNNLDNQVFLETAEILKVIGHPIRLCILKGLFVEGEKNVTTMQGCLNIPQSTVSQHIGILKNKGIIKGRRNGLEINYSICNEKVIKILETLLKEELI